MGLVTTSTVTLGLGVLVYVVGDWFLKSKERHVTDLLPFIYAWLYGMLFILGVGGVAGWIADFAMWGVGWAADTAFVWGIGGRTQDVTRGSGVVLTNGGLSMFVLLSVVIWLLWRNGRVGGRSVGLGYLSGMCLGMSGTVAGAVAVPVASVVNLSGAWLSTEVMW